MAVALRGSLVAGPNGNPTTGGTLVIDAAVQSGDWLELVFTSRDHTAGTAMPTVTDNDSGGNTWTVTALSADRKHLRAVKRATDATASKTVTIAGCVGSCSAVLAAWSGTDPSGDPTTNLSTESNASGDETHAGFTPSVADSMIRSFITNYANDNAVTSPSWATLGAATGSAEKLSTGGSDCATHTAYRLQSGGPTGTGDFTWAQTNGTTYSTLWALKPDLTQTVSPGLITQVAAPVDPQINQAVAAGLITALATPVAPTITVAGGGGGDVSIANVLEFTGTTDGTSYATGSWTPVDGKVYVVTVASRNTAGDPLVPTLSGNGITWNSDGTNGSISRSGASLRLTKFVGVASGSSAGALTASFGESTGSVVILIDECTNVDTSSPVVQWKAVAGASGVAVTGTFAASVDAANAVHASMSQNSGDETLIIEGSGFTRLGDNVITSPGQVSVSEYDPSSASDTFNFTPNSTNQWNLIGIELRKASGGGGGQTVSPALLSQAASPVAPRVDLAAAPALLVQTAAVLAPRVDQQVRPGLTSQPAAVLSPTVSPGNVNVSPALLSQPATPVAPRIDLSISPALLTRLVSPIAPSRLDLQVAPALLTQSAAPVSPTVLSGLTVAPAVITATATAIAPSRLDQSLSPAIISVPATAIAFARIDQRVVTVLLAQPAAPIAPRLDQQVSPALVTVLATPIAFARIDQRVTPSLLAQLASAVAPTLTSGTTVLPGVLSQPATPVAPTVVGSQQVSPGLISRPATPIAPALALSVSIPLISVTAQALAPQISAGAQTVQATLLVQTVTVLAPDILSGLSWGGEPVPEGWALHVTPDGSAAVLVPSGAVSPSLPGVTGYNLKPE